MAHHQQGQLRPDFTACVAGRSRSQTPHDGEPAAWLYREPYCAERTEVTRTRETGWYHRHGGSQQIRRKAGAAGGYRTYDLSLTKGVLYH